ncbi:2185_t:CDS:1, partial [Rhizophagus irregularis]
NIAEDSSAATKFQTKLDRAYFEISDNNTESVFPQCKVIEDGEMECI